MIDDRGFLRVLDARLDAASRRAGVHLPCRPGCAECCIGPFPISDLDARRLREGMESLRASDPARAERVRARALAQVESTTRRFPGDPRSGVLSPEDAVVDEFLDAEASTPCACLDPDDETCDLYAWRPVSCRTFGPPVRIGVEILPPCRLCFVGASPEEIALHTVDPDPDGIEDALRQDPGETLVAWALATRPPT